MVMTALLWLSTEHMFTTQASLKCCDQPSLLLARGGLCLMMEVPLAVLLSWSFQFFQWTMRKCELWPNYLSEHSLLTYISTKAALLLGSKSGWVCPPYLAPKNFLCDLSDVIYPLWTWDGTLRLIRGSERCKTKAKASEVLLTQSIRNIPVCVCMGGLQVSDFYSRIHSSTTSASIWLSTACFVQMPSTRLRRVSGNICGKWSNWSIRHLQNFKFWMISESLFRVPTISLLTSGYLASRGFLHFLVYTTLQMGCLTCLPLLQKNRALFSV